MTVEPSRVRVVVPWRGRILMVQWCGAVELPAGVPLTPRLWSPIAPLSEAIPGG